MNVKTYQNFSKRTNETKTPASGGTDVNVELKQATSIMSPTLILSGFDPSMNYIDIPGWNRKYFVNDYRKGNNDLFEVSCEEDIAGTWKSYIGNYSCFIERSASNYNTDLYDSAISSEEKVTNVNHASTSLWAGGGVYMARVINSTTGVTTYIGTLDTFAGLFNPISDDPSILDTIEAILQYYLYNPREYLLDVYFLPIGLSEFSTTLDALLVGWATTSGSAAYRYTGQPVLTDTVTLNKPTPYYTDFREGAGAFSNYSIYIPAVGSVSLPGDIIDKTLQIKYCIDVYTGEVSYNLIADGDLIATYHGNLKTSIQIGGLMPSGSGLISTALMGASAMTGNIAAITAFTINGIQNTIQSPPSIIGAPGSCCSVLNESDVVITQMNKDSSDIPTAVAGRPCCKNLQIGNLSGYVKCGNASIDIPGTKAEKDAVNALLNGGFYYT